MLFTKNKFTDVSNIGTRLSSSSTKTASLGEVVNANATHSESNNATFIVDDVIIVVVVVIVVTVIVTVALKTATKNKIKHRCGKSVVIVYNNCDQTLPKPELQSLL